MFSHILLATDLTRASEPALHVAATLSRVRGGRLTVLHVYEVTAHVLGETPPAVAERTWPGGVRARRALDGVVHRLRAHGLQADGALRFGMVSDQVVGAAVEHGVDVVVMGTGRRRGLARAWYGSVTDAVVRGASVPVLAVPGAGVSENVVRFRRP